MTALSNSGNSTSDTYIQMQRAYSSSVTVAAPTMQGTGSSSGVSSRPRRNWGLISELRITRPTAPSGTPLSTGFSLRFPEHGAEPCSTRSKKQARWLPEPQPERDSLCLHLSTEESTRQEENATHSLRVSAKGTSSRTNFCPNGTILSNPTDDI